MQKIYDCFTFFNELDILELRLKILYPYVDYFVISEMTQTFFGKKKPLNFEKYKNRFSKYMDKIIYIPSDGPRLLSFFKTNFFKKINRIKIFSIIVNRLYLGQWKLQVFQRNNLAKGLKNCDDNDIILISDVDEILNPEVMPEIRQSVNEGEERISINQKNYIYYLNGYCIDCPFHHLMKATKYKTLKIKFKNSPQKLRVKRNFFLSQIETNTKLIKNGGWHFTYIGGIEKVEEKMNSVCAGLLYKSNKKEYKRLMDKGIAMGSTRRIKYLNNLDYLPNEIFKDMKKWKPFIKKNKNI